MPTINDIKQILADGGITTTIYLDDIPAKVNTAVGLYTNAGQSAQHTFGAVAFRRPSVQIITRSPATAASLALAEAIRDLLDGQTEVTVGAKVYMSIRCVADIINLGKSDAGYHQHSINFDLMVR